MIEWSQNPVLFDLGFLEIRYYGVFFATALFLAYSLARKMCGIKKLSLEKLDKLAFYVILGLILGARFGHILFYELSYYMSNPLQIIKVWEGGLASHGATIGILIASFIFIKTEKKFNFFEYSDIIVVAASFPIALVRLGNFFNSEIYGRASDLPWSVIFTRIDDIPRHPSQIYEFLIGVSLLLILYPLWIKKNATMKPGFLTGLFFILYFLMRFIVEFFKEYPLHTNFLNLTTGQILSLPFILLGVLLLLKARQTHALK